MCVRVRARACAAASIFTVRVGTNVSVSSSRVNVKLVLVLFKAGTYIYPKIQLNKKLFKNSVLFSRSNNYQWQNKTGQKRYDHVKNKVQCFEM